MVAAAGGQFCGLCSRCRVVNLRYYPSLASVFFVRQAARFSLCMQCNATIVVLDVLRGGAVSADDGGNE